jgi:hypothetical protein
MNPTLTDTQVRLINELCDYVEANVAPENFDMGRYRNADNFEHEHAASIQELVKENPDTNVCGTSGCMIGYAPMCHPELHKDATTWEAVSNTYCEETSIHIDDYSIWEFLFGPTWEDFQNTPQGSVDRIRLALEYNGKLSVADWDYMYDFACDASVNTYALKLEFESLTECK